MIKIFVCGDFRAKDASKVNLADDIKAMLSTSDFAICNFEAPVTGGGKSIEKSGPVLNQDKESANFLKKLGFNILLLANNHIMDYGREGCEKTIDAFSDCVCVGVGLAEDAYKVRIIEKDGKKIGLLALVQHEFGVIEDLQDRYSYGTAWINSPDVEDIIRESKKYVDFLMLFPHCGVENIDAPLPEWRKRYKRLIRCGADLIIATHPHCQQGWEIYEGKYIYYSLGNFYFDELKHGDKWFKSFGVEVFIDDKIQTKPICLKFEESGQIGIDKDRATRIHVEKLCYMLENEEMYNRYIEKECKEGFESLKYNILRGIGAYTPHIKKYYALRLFILMLMGKRKKMNLLNLFQNESHRWLIERYLKLSEIRKR